MIKLKSILILSFLLIGCLGSDQTSSTNEPYPYNPPPGSTLERELESAYLGCESGSTCPENIGMLYANFSAQANSLDLGVCTGFLIAPHIVATNSHCIPDYIKSSKNESLCQNQIAIRFMPSSVENKNIFICKKMLNFSKVVGLHQDYAFFEISENSARTPFVISKNGAANLDKIQTQVVTPTTSPSRGGEIQTHVCENVQGSLLAIKGNSRFSKIGLTIGCKTVHGNSGSPVLNQNGEVIGLLQSFDKDEFKDMLEFEFKDLGLQLPQMLPDHFVYTNLACVNDPVTETLSELCLEAEKISVFSCQKDSIETQASKEEDILRQTWQKQLPKIFKYKFVFSVKEKSLTAEPVCVLTQDQNPQVYEEYVHKEGFIGLRSEVIKQNFSNKIKYSIQMMTDNSFRINRVQLKGDYINEQSISLVKKNQFWEGTSKVKTYGTAHSMFDKLLSSELPLKLKSCFDVEFTANELNWVFDENDQLLSEEEYKKNQKKEKINPELCN